MAKNTLPVNYQDDILNSSMNGKRRYNLIQNADGTYSLEDVSTYDQVGSNFGASNINATNTAVNESFDKNKIIRSLDDISALTKDGYVPDALALKEVNSSLSDIAPTYLNSETKIYFRYATWGGVLTAGQTNLLGNIDEHIPNGYTFVGMLLTPRADRNILMSWLIEDTINIYAYSETYSGEFNYDALLVLTK